MILFVLLMILALGAVDIVKLMLFFVALLGFITEILLYIGR